jgi:cobalt-zinc-cadmium efflux system membrane fusion protein
VQGHIFDRDLPDVRVGDRVDETNASIPNVFHGVISYIGAQVDPATRTTPVRIVTPNPRGLLKKDTFVEAVVHTGTQKHVLTVPTSAVMRTTENQPFVYLQVQTGKFAQRLVTIGEQQDGRVEILSGLKSGDLIVSEGSLFLEFANSNQ